MENLTLKEIKERLDASIRVNNDLIGMNHEEIQELEIDARQLEEEIEELQNKLEDLNNTKKESEEEFEEIFPLEDLNIHCEGMTPLEIFNIIFYGDIGSWRPKYIRFNGYANLENADDEYEELEEEIQELEEEIEELEEEIEELQNKLEEIEEEIEILNNQIEKCEDENEQTMDYLDTLKNLIEDMNKWCLNFSSNDNE